MYDVCINSNGDSDFDEHVSLQFCLPWSCFVCFISLSILGVFVWVWFPGGDLLGGSFLLH